MASPTSEPTGWRPTYERWHKGVDPIADACAKFVAEVEAGAPPRWLTITGVPGNGKTMFGRQTYAEALKHNERATASWPGQFGEYREDRRRPHHRWLAEDEFARAILDGKQYDFPEYLAHEWLVGYDDLGAKTFMSHDARAGFADCVLRLANRRLGKWTIWTTNLTLSEIVVRFDARLTSRLLRDGNRIVTNTAPDYALRPGR